MRWAVGGNVILVGLVFHEMMLMYSEFSDFVFEGDGV